MKGRHEMIKSISARPSKRMLVHRRVTPSIKFVVTHLYTLMELGTVSYERSVLLKNATQCPLSGLEP